MMTVIRKLIAQATLLLLILTQTAWADPVDVGDLLARMQEHHIGLADLSASFTHTREVPLFDEAITAHGRLFFSDPDRLMILYTDPDSSMVLIDGDRIWLHYPRLQQAHRYDIDPESALPGLFLGLHGKLDRMDEKFDVTAEWGRRESGFATDVLILHPKEGTDLSGEVEKIRIVLRRDDSLPVQTEFLEASGDLSRFTLTDFRRNPGLDESIFLFDPPEGTEVFELEGETW